MIIKLVWLLEAQAEWRLVLHAGIERMHNYAVAICWTKVHKFTSVLIHQFSDVRDAWTYVLVVNE